MPSIADLDGDGAVEVIVEGAILNGVDGTVKHNLSAPLASVTFGSPLDLATWDARPPEEDIALVRRASIGPVADVVQYDVLVEELENVGIMDPYLITQ